MFFLCCLAALCYVTLCLMGGGKFFFVRRLHRLLIPVMSWNVVYMAFALGRVWKNGDAFDAPVEILNKFFSFEYNPNMWFFVPLICVYITMPFVAVFALNAKRETLRMYLLISLAFSVLAPLDSTYSVRTSFLDIYIYGTRFLVYVIAGYYLGRFEISYLTRRRLYICSFLCIGMMIIGTTTLSLFVPSHYKYFIQYTNVPCTILAYSVFVYFRYTNWNSILEKIKIRPQYITKLSSLSLGIYLVQKMGFYMLGHISFLKDNMIMVFPIMYVGCIGIVWLLKQVPVMNKIV